MEQPQVYNFDGNSGYGYGGWGGIVPGFLGGIIAEQNAKIDQLTSLLQQALAPKKGKE